MPKDIYLYGTIPASGGSYTVTKIGTQAPNGTITTGRVTGYGPFPFDKYPGIPVIDFTDSPQVIAAIAIPDRLRPRESNPKFHAGTLKTYLQAIADLGIPIYNYTPGAPGNNHYLLLAPLAAAIRDGSGPDLPQAQKDTIKTALENGDICLGPRGFWIVRGGPPLQDPPGDYPQHVIPAALVGTRIE